jgi:hypothetical protein
LGIGSSFYRKEEEREEEERKAEEKDNPESRVPEGRGDGFREQKGASFLARPFLL